MSDIKRHMLGRLVENVEKHHDQYLQSLRDLHDGLGDRSIRGKPDTTNEHFTPPVRAFTGPVFTTDHSERPSFGPTLNVDTHECPHVYPSPDLIPVTPDPSTTGFSVRDQDLSFIPLLDGTTPSSSSPRVPASKPPPVDNLTPRTTRPLTPMGFTDHMLLRHLRYSEFWGDTAKMLDPVLRQRSDIDLAVPFGDFAAYERESYVSANFEIYDVAADATAKKLSVDADVQGLVKYGQGVYETVQEEQEEIVDAPRVWTAIKDVNLDGQSVGRITIVQEPTPLILAALHLAMSPHFDMAEILEHLVSEIPNYARSHACMDRAFQREPYTPTSLISEPSPSSFAHLRQRSFFFVFKYYTVVGDGLEPSPWQRFDKRPSDKRTGDHVDIAECGSILALSLEGNPTKHLTSRPRRERMREGFLFDTFAPWHILSIQSFPDDQHTTRGEDFQQTKSFYSGPYAFLDLLISEYRDAGKRNQILHERITKLITPPPEFMFDHRLRDKLLFEDKHFTYIRRYFWAFNTLAVINNGIKAMVAAYFDTFTEEFWEGAHPLLWPVASSSDDNGNGTLSPDAVAAYREKMAILRRELEKVIKELSDVLKRNERTRKEIENLRDQLFSGSSIKESRRAIDQGDNIRILTMISMIFLPLTFVTSVFGMTEFSIPAHDWRFALTMILVCVPFMLLVILFQTRHFNLALHRAAVTTSRLFSYPGRLLKRRWLQVETTESTAATNSMAGGGGDAVSPRIRRRRVVVERRRGWWWEGKGKSDEDEDERDGRV